MSATSMTDAAPKIAAPRSDRFAPLLRVATRRGAVHLGLRGCYFVAIRFIESMAGRAARTDADAGRRVCGAVTDACRALRLYPGVCRELRGMECGINFSFPASLRSGLRRVRGGISGLVLVARAAARRWTNAGAALVFPILYAGGELCFTS